MKRQKLHRLVHTTVLFALILSACGGFANNTANDDANNDADSNRSYEQPANIAENSEGDYSESAANNVADDSYAEAPNAGASNANQANKAGADAYSEPAVESEELGGGANEAYPQPVGTAVSNNNNSGDSPYQEPGSEVDEGDPYGGTTFDDYGTNPFVDTDHDNLSTFAMDVDTGAYTVSRNYLQDGLLPPQNAVRVEEFINYFDYNYPQPRSSDIFGISLDGAPTPFTEGSDYDMLRVGIQGMEISDYDRDDLVLTFVIDVSGSMDQDNRLEMVKDALHLLVNELRRSDTVTIIAYSDTAWLVLEPTGGNDKNRINSAIAELWPTYSTNTEAGLRLGYLYADEAFDRKATNRVLLLSDGVANVGNTGPGSIWETIERYAGDDIYLTTVGVGMGTYNDVLLEQLADMGNGNYNYIDTMDEAERLFVEDFTGTLQTIAKDAKVQVTFNPEVVERYRLLGYENRDVADEDFDDPSVDAGEVGAGHSVTALYEIKLFRGAKGEVATVTLHWEDPDTGKLYEIKKSIRVSDLEDRFEQASPSFQQAVVVAEFAEILRGSYFAENSSLSEVMEIANFVYSRLEYSKDFAELMDMIDTARRKMD